MSLFKLNNKSKKVFPKKAQYSQSDKK